MQKFHAPKRVFIGIKLADELEDEFVHLGGELGDLPGKFIPPQDIHLTLVPPFETRDWLFTESELHRALDHVHTFKLGFDELDWGPDRERPWLAWVSCSVSDELIELKEILLTAFDVKDKVPFVPHMTIARFKKEEGDVLAKRSIRRDVPLFMNVTSVELFESPHKGGVGYSVLSSISLKPVEDTPA